MHAATAFLPLRHPVTVTLDSSKIKRSLIELRRIGVRPNGAGIFQVEVIGVTECREVVRVNSEPELEGVIPQITKRVIHMSSALETAIREALASVEQPASSTA